MDKKTFLQILGSKEGTKLFTFISSFGKSEEFIQTCLDQYDPKKHAIFDKIKRKDRTKFVPTGRRDEFGKLVRYPDDNSPETRQEQQCVSRISIAMQQEVTEAAAAVLCTNPVELIAKEGDAGAMQDIWDNNKLQFKNLDICTKWLSETEVAELWYKEKNEDGKNEVKSIVLANSLGNRLFPVLDDFGKLICFGRTYISQTWVDAMLADEKFCEIYTDTDVIKGSDNATGEWSFDAPVKHLWKKIPVLYATRALPIWYNVQDAIERTEQTISNLCDTNDYFGSPLLAVIGSVESLPGKGEPGKVVEIDKDGDLKYVTWDQAPEAIKLEMETLSKIVANDCKYVNLSPESLKGLFGSAPSSYAIKLLFIPAHQLAKKNEDVFGEFVQRRINLLLSDLGSKSDTIQAKFTYLLPKNDAEEIANINTAKTGGFLSQESAVTDSPLTVDKDTELKKLKDEAPAAAKPIVLPNPVL